MGERIINFGVIGCGLMGREFASAAARWNHLLSRDVCPRIIAACDTSSAVLSEFCAANPGVRGYADYRELLAQADVEALYIAVPHNLHTEAYIAAINAGKHFLGEKPFGIDRAANQQILSALSKRPDLLVRCSSEFPFFPGAQKIIALAHAGKMGRILEVRCGLLHSSDMDPLKPINWKRRIATNGEYGCMGDLGMHAVHVPLRLGYVPRDVRAMLTKVVKTRPDGKGGEAPCETWDNALLACTVGSSPDDEFPMLLEMKRIAPGHVNTWYLEISGTAMSARFSTRFPRTLELLPYERGKPQAWHVQDLGYESAYPAITGGIFEFGFPDAIQQMWAAFCDELANGPSGMKQPFRCVTPRETELSHLLFDAALRSAGQDMVIRVE
ncbi:MAG: Gfo/Idh/MocA family oxidoreductase [Phycisphaerales bacterium]|nr:Gfo/Idh/MocA family oxidoreductase [Phycisphaerales bacterium]